MKSIHQHTPLSCHRRNISYNSAGDMTEIIKLSARMTVINCTSHFSLAALIVTYVSGSVAQSVKAMWVMTSLTE